MHFCLTTYKFGNKLYSINEKSLEEVLADVPLVTEQLAIYEFYKRFVLQRLTIINISRRYHKVEKLSFSLQIKCNLKPKNQPIEHFPLWAMPLKTLLIFLMS